MGKTFFAQGYAIAAFNGEVVAHELTHLTTMKGHYTGSDPGQPSTWTSWKGD